jgi:hypothetical protein
VILTDVTPYLPLQDRTAYEAIAGEVSVLEQRLNDLKADILLTRDKQDTEEGEKVDQEKTDRSKE